MTPRHMLNTLAVAISLVILAAAAAALLEATIAGIQTATDLIQSIE